MAACCFHLGFMVTLTVIVLMCIILYSPGTPGVTLASLTMTRLNFTENHIYGYLSVQFQVVNPNMDSDFFYHKVCCSVYQSKHHLASTMLLGFVQTGRETKPINITIPLMQGTTAPGIRYDLATSGFAEFDVKLTTVMEWFWKHKNVRVSCDDVAVAILPAIGGHGKMIGPARTCQVS